MLCNNILEAIGHTPLVRLNRMAKASPRAKSGSRPIT